MIKVFGIPNCDTVKKTIKYLKSNGTPYDFHNFRSDGFPKAQVQIAIEQIGIDTLINKRSKTWKELDTQQKEKAMSENSIELLEEFPTLIKRPLINNDGNFSCGYNEANLI